VALLLTQAVGVLVRAAEQPAEDLRLGGILLGRLVSRLVSGLVSRLVVYLPRTLLLLTN